jgi:hypothetical protein
VYKTVLTAAMKELDIKRVTTTVSNQVVKNGKPGKNTNSYIQASRPHQEHRAEPKN